MSIVDALGQGFPPGSGNERLVSLVPSVTETLFDFGVGDRLVGITDYCVRPESGLEGMARVGGPKNPQLERILALRPDLVIANQEENHPKDVYALRERGVRVFVSFPCTVEQAISFLWDLAWLTGTVDQARPLIQAIKQARDALLRMRADRCPVSVFCPIWRDPWMTFNAGTYAHDLLAVCGGHNVFAARERRYPLAADLGQREPLSAERVEGRDTRYPRVTLKEAAGYRPEVTLLPSEPYCFSEADRAELLETLDAPAARSGRVYRVDGSLITWHGTRMLAAFQTLPELL